MLVLFAMVALSGCGTAAPDRALSELATQGRDIALSRGCSACHGENGEGGVGPAWQGLAGNTVELEGGGAVVADADYLRRAIADPQAEVVAGTSITMPVTELADSEIEALVAYVEELQ